MMNDLRARVVPHPPREIAFLLCRDHAVICHDVLNAARVWAHSGARVDILALGSSSWPRPEQIAEGVRLVAPQTLGGRLRAIALRCAGAGAGAAVTEPTGGPSSRERLARAVARLLSLLQKSEYLLRYGARLLFGRYGLVIACDTPGLLAARAARALRGVPYIYHVRELVLSGDQKTVGGRIAKALERSCHRSAALTVVQDERRADLIARDNDVSIASFSMVPNAPLGTRESGPSDYLADTHGLPRGTPIVLHAGSVIPEHMVLEIVESVEGWPTEAVLVVHGVPGRAYGPQLRAAAARFPGRVLFSSVIVPPERVDDLFASAAVGLAFYRPIDENFRSVGHAAGKIFNFMKVGVPTIANDLPGLKDLLEGNGCGLVVAAPADIGPALARLLEDRSARRAACLAAFPRYEFERNYRAVVRRAASLL